MAPKAFLLLTLAFAVVLLITSEVAAAKELAENTDSEIGRVGHIIGGGHGGYDKVGGHGGRYDVGGGRACKFGCRGDGGHDKVGGHRGRYDARGGRACRFGCSGHGGHDKVGGHGGHDKPHF